MLGMVWALCSSQAVARDDKKKAVARAKEKVLIIFGFSFSPRKWNQI
jgi:hypothetical protein